MPREGEDKEGKQCMQRGKMSLSPVEVRKEKEGRGRKAEGEKSHEVGIKKRRRRSRASGTRSLGSRNQVRLPIEAFIG
jgi:hypothetical protein